MGMFSHQVSDAIISMFLFKLSMNNKRVLKNSAKPIMFRNACNIFDIQADPWDKLMAMSNSQLQTSRF